LYLNYKNPHDCRYILITTRSFFGELSHQWIRANGPAANLRLKITESKHNSDRSYFNQIQFHLESLCTFGRKHLTAKFRTLTGTVQIYKKEGHFHQYADRTSLPNRTICPNTTKMRRISMISSGERITSPNKGRIKIQLRQLTNKNELKTKKAISSSISNKISS